MNEPSSGVETRTEWSPLRNKVRVDDATDYVVVALQPITYQQAVDAVKAWLVANSKLEARAATIRIHYEDYFPTTPLTS